MKDHDGRGWPEDRVKAFVRLQMQRDYWKRQAALWMARAERAEAKVNHPAELFKEET